MPKGQPFYKVREKIKKTCLLPESASQKLKLRDAEACTFFKRKVTLLLPESALMTKASIF